MKAQEHMSPNAEIVQPSPQAAAGNGTAKKLRVLSRGECVELLSSHGLGRLAFAVGRQAKIFPVNYLLDGDSVVVRTGHGFKQAEAPMRDVAFEVDAAGADGVWGWSVVVTGVCFDVTRCLDTTSERERELPIRPWAPGQRDQWLRITAKQISGRAFGSPPELAATAHSTSPLLDG